MSKSIVKPPEYWFWIKDWVSAIKNRTGWTDEDLAKRIGTGSRNLQYIVSRPPSGRVPLVFRLMALSIEKTERNQMDKDTVACNGHVTTAGKVGGVGNRTGNMPAGNMRRK